MRRSVAVQKARCTAPSTKHRQRRSVPEPSIETAGSGYTHRRWRARDAAASAERLESASHTPRGQGRADEPQADTGTSPLAPLGAPVDLVTDATAVGLKALLSIHSVYELPLVAGRTRSPALIASRTPRQDRLRPPVRHERDRRLPARRWRLPLSRSPRQTGRATRRHGRPVMTGAGPVVRASGIVAELPSGGGGPSMKALVRPVGGCARAGPIRRRLGSTVWQASQRRQRARSMSITRSRCRRQSKPGLAPIVEHRPHISIPMSVRLHVGADRPGPPGAADQLSGEREQLLLLGLRLRPGVLAGAGQRVLDRRRRSRPSPRCVASELRARRTARRLARAPRVLGRRTAGTSGGRARPAAPLWWGSAGRRCRRRRRRGARHRRSARLRRPRANTIRALSRIRSRLRRASARSGRSVSIKAVSVVTAFSPGSLDNRNHSSL